MTFRPGSTPAATAAGSLASPSAPIAHLWRKRMRPQPAGVPRLLIPEIGFMDMTITFPGGARVDAEFGPYTIRTDQPPQGGGEGSAPAPFTLFLASIGTCAGIYVLGFCKQRGLPTEGIRIVQRTERDPRTGLVGKVGIDIEVPPDFPTKYYDALIRAADQCAVKKHLEHPPQFDVRTVAK
jgi:ribosomal protein S12 methylthiotransferase accessory factor